MIRGDNLNQRTENLCLWKSRFVWEPKSHGLQSKCSSSPAGDEDRNTGTSEGCLVQLQKEKRCYASSSPRVCYPELFARVYGNPLSKYCYFYFSSLMIPPMLGELGHVET